MKQRWTWALTAVVVAGIILAGAMALTRSVSHAAERAALPPGVKVNQDTEDPADVRKTFETLTEAALTKGGFDDLIERLADQDRNRIGNFAEQEFRILDGRIDQIRKAWKDKYGKELKVERDKALAQVALLRGEIESPEQVGNHWPVPVMAKGQGGDAITAAAADNATDDAAKSKPDLNSNIEQGRDVAIATLPASNNLPQLNVSLIHEAQGWRVDVPNTLAGREIHDRLLDHLTYLGDNATQWPADANDAAAVFARHVVMAVYGLPVPQAQQQQQQQRQPPPGTAGGSQNQNAVPKAE
jgi:hypothetical protein